LIGKGGAAITAIRQASMSEVKVSHSEGEPMATVTITGNVALAEKLITEHLTEARRPKSVQWEVRLLDVPQELVGQTIGPGGSNLREMKDKSGCQIAFVQARDFDETAPEGKQLARIKGPPEKVPEAERLLIEKVQEVQQIHINKSMNRQMSWGYDGGMHMGGACGAAAWSHWVHNDMGDSMQAARRWVEEPLEGVGVGFYDETIPPQQQQQQPPMPPPPAPLSQEQQQQQQQQQAAEPASAIRQAANAAEGQTEAPSNAVSKSAMMSKPPSKKSDDPVSDSAASTWDAAAASSTAAAVATTAIAAVGSEATATSAGAAVGAAVGVATSALENWWDEAGSGGKEGKGAASKGMPGKGPLHLMDADMAAKGMHSMGAPYPLDIETGASMGSCVMDVWGMDCTGAIAVDGCMDAWGMDGIAYPPDASRAWRGKGRLAMPRHYQMQGPGACRNGEPIAFSHTPEVLGAALGMGGGMAPEVPQAQAVPPEDYKMTYCKFWDSGQCSRGDSCPNAHGIDELRGGLTPKNLKIMEEAQEMMMALEAQGGGAQQAAADEPALNRDNLPAAFRTVAFQQRLQQTARGPPRMQQQQGWI